MTVIEELVKALDLADDVLRVVLKVHGSSPLVELTRCKIAEAKHSAARVTAGKRGET